MQRYTQKQIRSFGGRDKFNEKVNAWQAEHNTTGLPRACSIGCERVGYSVGVYGCNGSLFRDTETGEYYGLGYRGYHIYID